MWKEPEFYQDNKKEWRWRIRAENGEIVQASHEGFMKKSDCEANLKSLENWSADNQFQRKELRAFGTLVEARIRSHDEKKGKDGWKGSPMPWLLVKMMEEAGEIAALMFTGEWQKHPTKVHEEAADVAAMAMMIADRAAPLCK